MATLEREDGTEIHWEERGEGPLVVVMSHTYAYPGLLEGLLGDLVSDHRVVTYDARGTGGSSRRGPYDLATDSADLEALIEEQGEPGVALAWGDSGHRAVLLGAERPELLPVVVVMGGGAGMVRTDETAGAEGLQGSDAVRSAFTEMLRTDYRSALRWAVSSTSPQLTDDEVRERVERGVEYCSQEAAVERFRYWMQSDETAERAEQLGERLWVIQFPTTWNPRETIEMVRKRLPRAHVIELAESEGPLSRPAITAGIVRSAADPLRGRK
jgi:pimeloyl-ACP methyl ester carboxylesterase